MERDRLIFWFLTCSIVALVAYTMSTVSPL